MATVMKMSVQEWIKVKDNPIQRDTERRLARAKHLLTNVATHAIVFAARLPNGTLIKLDGHTRALLWSRGLGEPPKSLDVNVIPVSDINEAIALYKTFDSKDAVETATDKMSGGFRKMGFKPESPLVASGALTSALNLTWTAVYGWAADKKPKDIYQVINEFSAEILALDELGLARNVAPSGIIAAFILSYRKHDDAVIPFWRGVFKNAGTKMKGEMDGIQAVSELIAQKTSNSSSKRAFDLCARALMAVEKWLADDMLSTAPRPVDIAKYLEKGPDLRRARKRAAA